LLEKQLETVDLPDDLPLRMLRQRTAITGPKLFQFATPIPAQRRISGYPLSEQPCGIRYWRGTTPCCDVIWLDWAEQMRVGEPGQRGVARDQFLDPLGQSRRV
jgi:hypothetical protein